MSASTNKYFFISKKSTFIATFQKIFLHLQCLAFETGEMARQITLSWAFFYAQALPIYPIVPSRGVSIMGTQPVSGARQRGAELFLFPLRI